MAEKSRFSHEMKIRGCGQVSHIILDKGKPKDLIKLVGGGVEKHFIYPWNIFL